MAKQLVGNNVNHNHGVIVKPDGQIYNDNANHVEVGQATSVALDKVDKFDRQEMVKLNLQQGLETSKKLEDVHNSRMYPIYPINSENIHIQADTTMDDVFSDTYSLDELDALEATPEYQEDLEAIHNEIKVEKKFPGFRDIVGRYSQQFDETLQVTGGESLTIPLHEYRSVNDHRTMGINYTDSQNYELYDVSYDNKPTVLVVSCKDGQLSLDSCLQREVEAYADCVKQGQFVMDMDVRNRLTCIKLESEFDKLSEPVKKASKFTGLEFSESVEFSSAFAEETGYNGMGIDRHGEFDLADSCYFEHGLSELPKRGTQIVSNMYASGEIDKLKQQYKDKVNEAVHERKAIIEQYKTNPEKSHEELLVKEGAKMGADKELIDRLVARGSAMNEQTQEAGKSISESQVEQNM